MTVEDEDVRWLDRLLDALHESLDSTDRILAQGIQGVTKWHEKRDRDPVAEVDLAIERRLREFLFDLTPDVPFVGEETGGEVPDTGLAWVVDPLDGTVNFLEGIPLCGTSIGLVRDGQPILGAVSLPLLGSRFSGGPAIQSTENGKAISVSDVSAMRGAIVSVGDYSTGDGADRKNERKIEVQRALAPEVYRIRMLGSAAIDLAWLASGRLHGTVTMSNNSWDMCGGVAIALGAGAHVTDARGMRYSMASESILAAAPGVWRALCDKVEEAF